MAYLDDTGLAYFWGKIKAWANSVFALISHTHAASDVTAMTGYSMPQASSAISSGDTLNQAVGKLEKAIDMADISNVVHRTGTEFIAGGKYFKFGVSTNFPVSQSGAQYISDDPNIVRGSADPNNNHFMNVSFWDYNTDPSSFVSDTDYQKNILGSLQYALRSNNRTDLSLLCAKNTDPDDPNEPYTYASLRIGYDENGLPFTTCTNTRSERTTSNDVLTRSYIPIINSGVAEGDRVYIETSGVNAGVIDLSKGKHFILSGVSANSTITLSLANGPSSNVTGDFDLVVENGGTYNINWFPGVNNVNWIDMYKAPVRAVLSPSGNDFFKFIKYGHYYVYRCNYLRTLSSGATLNLNDVVSSSIIYYNSGATVTNAPAGVNGIVYTFGNDNKLLKQFWFRQGTLNSNDDQTFFRTCYYNDDTSLWEFSSWYKLFHSGMTVPLENGGTASTTRLGACKTFTNENVGSSPNYFVTFTSNWAKFGYSSIANAKTALGISGSDRYIKQDFADIPEEVLAAWENVSWIKFRFMKEAREQGESAKFHVGAVVQDIQKALAGGGVDPSGYGMMYHEDYPDDEANEPSAENPDLLNKDKWYLRYDEALCMEAAYQRRENARLKKRIADLEERLAALELKAS